MKFLGVAIYASAILATTAYASPGHYKEKGSEGGWRHHYRGKKHPPVEEIHYQVITPNPTTTTSPAPTVRLANHHEMGYMCPVGDTTELGQELSHFTGIFYNDFTTGGTGQKIHGPLAVGRKFHAPNYAINANQQVSCNADRKTPFDSIGLVVGGDSTTSGTHVRGDSFIAGNGDSSQFEEQLEGCRVRTDEGTGHFDFALSFSNFDALSRSMAAMEPDSVLNAGGAVTRKPTVDNTPFRVFKMNTCDGSCPTKEALSTPDEMLFGDGNWNGPSGDAPSSGDTVIINIPVTTHSTITLGSNAKVPGISRRTITPRANDPSHGFDSCRIIYNFYPVDKQGNFDSNGDFTLNRETGSQLEGLVIAPRAHIRDGNRGNFAGTVIGNDYAWLDPSSGAEIHDWAAASCPRFEGCLPLIPAADTCTPSTTTQTKTVPTTVTTTKHDTITKYVAQATVTNFATTTDVRTATVTLHDTKKIAMAPVTETVTIADRKKEEEWTNESSEEGKGMAVEIDDEWTKWSSENDEVKTDEVWTKWSSEDEEVKTDEVWTKWDGDDDKGKGDEVWTKWDGDDDNGKGDGWKDDDEDSW